MQDFNPNNGACHGSLTTIREIAHLNTYTWNGISFILI